MTTSTPMAPRGAADSAAARPEPAERTGQDPPAREVVVGVDGSECGLRAVRWATREAALRNAPLRIIHAASYLSRRGDADSPPPELARARQITGQAYTVARHTEREVPTTTEVVPGDAVGTLLDAATSAQLVVLGSSTTGVADELVLAPVAARLAARSPLPVVVVPRQRGGTPAERPVVAVFGIGEPEDDEEVARFAATAARRWGVPLSLLQTRPAERTEVASWTDVPAEWSRREPDLEVRRTELPRPSAGDLLSASCPTPLLVLSTGHGHLLHRTLDGPHRWLLRHCTSPMALVPPAHRRAPAPGEEDVPLG